MLRFLMVALLALLLAACSGNEDANPEPTPASTPRTPATASGSPVAPGPSPTPGAIVPRHDITGLFTEPQPVEIVAVLELPERPASSFGDWDGRSVVLYDIDNGVHTSFGAGRVWTPAFGGGHFVYTSADNEVWVVDLETLSKRSLGRGVVAYFLGDNHVVINPGDNAFVAVELATDERTPVDKLSDPVLRGLAKYRIGGSYRAQVLGSGYVLRPADPSPNCDLPSMPAKHLCEAQAAEEWVVENLRTGEIRFFFNANRVSSAGPNEFVMATPPICADDNGNSVYCHQLLADLEMEASDVLDLPPREGTTNIFIVNLFTGEAQFMATATYNVTHRSWPMVWPLIANQEYVVWTESYCGQPEGMTRILHRETGEIYELNASLWASLRGGRLNTGQGALLDPETLEYLTVLPENAAMIAWSGDFRYAAVGAALARGGPCG